MCPKEEAEKEAQKGAAEPDPTKVLKIARLRWCRSEGQMARPIRARVSIGRIARSTGLCWVGHIDDND